MKPFALPVELIEKINILEPADRGLAFTAIYTYIDSGATPDESVSAAARLGFETALMFIDPIIRRRRKSEERKAQKSTAAAGHPVDIPQAEAAAETEPAASQTEVPVDSRSTTPRNPDFETGLIKARMAECHDFSSALRIAFRSSLNPALRDDIIRDEFSRRHPDRLLIAFSSNGRYRCRGLRAS